MNNTNIIQDANKWWGNISPESRITHLRKLGKVIVYDEELIKLYLSENPKQQPTSLLEQNGDVEGLIRHDKMEIKSGLFTDFGEQIDEVTNPDSEMLMDLITIRNVTRAIEHEETLGDLAGLTPVSNTEEIVDSKINLLLSNNENSNHTEYFKSGYSHGVSAVIDILEWQKKQSDKIVSELIDAWYNLPFSYTFQAIYKEAYSRMVNAITVAKHSLKA